MTRTLPLLALLVATSSASAQFGQEQPKSKRVPKSFSEVGAVHAEITPASARPGERVTFKLTVTPMADAWTYPTKPAPGQAGQNTITLPTQGDLIFVGDVTDPKGVQTKPRDKGKPDGPFDLYYSKPTTWELTAFVPENAKPGKKTVALTGTRIQVCTDQTCLSTNSTSVPTASFEVLDGPAVPIPPQFAAAVQAGRVNPPVQPPVSVVATTHSESPPATSIVKKSALSPEAYAAELETIRTQITNSPTPKRTGLFGFLATAALWGLISLVTPCVFPMIPITVSIFLKQSHDSTAQTLKLAGVYCLTIVLVLGISAFALLKVFVDLSRDPTMNAFLGILFVVFALSLFGMYDLTLPQGMLRFTQKRQGSGGVFGAIFGAVAFTIIGFTCVAPFLGGFAGMASSGSYTTAELILGSLTFATAFASPFFLLALFPRMLKALPRSGGWLDSVKAVMGFLELAAAFKFFRTAELGLSSQPEYFTYDLVLGGWVAISAAACLYLLNVFRLPHDEEKPNIGVPRMIVALGFLGLAIYLLPATFKGPDGQPQRPAGVVYAWVDAFLLPDATREGVSELSFGTDLKDALDDARKEKQLTGKPSLVFVDFTGELCNNCKLNEKNVFPLPAVRDQLQKFRRVKLFTDWVPESYYTDPPSRAQLELEGEANGLFQEKAFGTRQLPLYVILEPLITGGVKVIGVYDEGKINDPAAFATFLRDALAKAANP